MQTSSDKKASEFRRYLLLATLIAIPVYLFSVYYTETVVPKDEEQAAFAATFFFLGGMYIGRYISQVWTGKPISSALFVGLCVGVILCLVWLFFHAEFPLNNRAFINLLLFYLPLFSMSVGIGMIVKLGRMAISNKLQAANARAEHSQSELFLLQSQLSPHFLFNTLNNMYGISIAQPEKVPTLLLKLSDLLRYSVYDAKDLFVPLKEELAYINNYIDFEKIRIGDRLKLTSAIEDVSNSTISIAPMLLIVFIENAFKHSKNTTDQTISIDITLKTWGNSILFSAKNSKGTAQEDSLQLEKNRGLGLANVQKRLELLYPNAYELEIQDESDFYTVMLQLKVK